MTPVIQTNFIAGLTAKDAVRLANHNKEHNWTPGRIADFCAASAYARACSGGNSVSLDYWATSRISGAPLLILAQRILRNRGFVNARLNTPMKLEMSWRMPTRPRGYEVTDLAPRQVTPQSLFTLGRSVEIVAALDSDLEHIVLAYISAAVHFGSRSTGIDPALLFRDRLGAIERNMAGQSFVRMLPKIGTRLRRERGFICVVETDGRLAVTWA